MLDRVDPGRDQPGQRVLAEDVGGDPGPELVRPGDRGREHVVGPRRGQVAEVAVDPVGGDLDPAVAAGGLPLDLGDQVVRLDLDAEVAEVAAGPGDVPAGPDQPGQVGAVLHATGCPPASRRRAAAARRRPGRRGPARPALRRRHSRPACSPMWQCASMKPGTIQPPSATVSASATGVERQPAVDDPRVAFPLVGQEHPRAQAQRGHRSAAPLARCRTASRVISRPSELAAERAKDLNADEPRTPPTTPPPRRPPRWPPSRPASPVAAAAVAPAEPAAAPARRGGGASLAASIS